MCVADTPGRHPPLRRPLHCMHPTGMHSCQTYYPPQTRYTPQDQVHTPPNRFTPQDQVHPLDQVHTPQDQVHPPGTRYTPWDQVHSHPPRPGTPPGTRYTTPDQVHPQSSACWEIRATSGRYASYWNAFLFLSIFTYPLLLDVSTTINVCRYDKTIDTEVF